MKRPLRMATIGLSMALCGAPALAEPPSAAGSASRGHELAQTWCGSCHQVADSDKARDAVPSFRTIANDPAMSAENLRAFLNRPHPPMPPLELSRKQIDDLIAYIGSLRR